MKTYKTQIRIIIYEANLSHISNSFPQPLDVQISNWVAINKYLQIQDKLLGKEVLFIWESKVEQKVTAFLKGFLIVWFKLLQIPQEGSILSCCKKGSSMQEASRVHKG